MKLKNLNLYSASIPIKEQLLLMDAKLHEISKNGFNSYKGTIVIM